jgi:DNA-binding protein H-NS
VSNEEKILKRVEKMETYASMLHEEAISVRELLAGSGNPASARKGVKKSTAKVLSRRALSRSK